MLTNVILPLFLPLEAVNTIFVVVEMPPLCYFTLRFSAVPLQTKCNTTQKVDYSTTKNIVL